MMTCLRKLVLSLLTSLALLSGAAPVAWAQAPSIAGVPLDSEYLVFVIDTSGSMRQYAWDDVQRLVGETIDAYPSIKGFHVISDEGEPLLDHFANDWIPNEPEPRAQMLEALSTWSAFSNSSPYEGILTAIDRFYQPGMNIGLYVYSDDFAAGSLEEVLTDVYERNHVSGTNIRKLRINAVAFPVMYQVTGTLLTAAGYAALMRDLCQRNGGSFIALSPR